MKRLIFSLVLLTTAFTCHAEVISKSETGFNLRITSEVDVAPDKAYKRFLRVDRWWIENHSYFGNRKNFRLEARAGGCFCEIDGRRQVQHMLVTAVIPGEEIKMIGGLGPLQMMGIHGGMSWRFEPTETGTRIIQTYNVTGYAPGGLLDLADIVDAVQTSQQNALVEYINSR